MFASLLAGLGGSLVNMGGQYLSQNLLNPDAGQNASQSSAQNMQPGMQLGAQFMNENLGGTFTNAMGQTGMGATLGVKNAHMNLGNSANAISTAQDLKSQGLSAMDNVMLNTEQARANMLKSSGGTLGKVTDALTGGGMSIAGLSKGIGNASKGMTEGLSSLIGASGSAYNNAANLYSQNLNAGAGILGNDWNSRYNTLVKPFETQANPGLLQGMMNMGATTSAAGSNAQQNLLNPAGGLAMVLGRQAGHWQDQFNQGNQVGVPDTYSKT